jgi:hypothetical protein
VALKLDLLQMDQHNRFAHAYHQLLHDIWATQSHNLNRLLREWRTSKADMGNMLRSCIIFHIEQGDNCSAERIGILAEAEREDFVKRNHDAALKVLVAQIKAEKSLFGRNGSHTAYYHGYLQKFLDSSSYQLPQIIQEKQSSQHVPPIPPLTEQIPDAVTIQREIHANPEVSVPVSAAHTSNTLDNDEGRA